MVELQCGEKILLLLILGVLKAFYIYKPFPGNVEEKWKIMLFNAVIKSASYLICESTYYPTETCFLEF